VNAAIADTLPAYDQHRGRNDRPHWQAASTASEDTAKAEEFRKGVIDAISMAA
jgi:hypothetical protein